MLFPNDIKVTMEKLAAEYEQGVEVDGEIVYRDDRGGENRYSYFLQGQLVFTFGISRGSRVRSKKLAYVPRSMHLTRKQYKALHKCPMSKQDYNNLILSTTF